MTRSDSLAVLTRIEKDLANDYTISSETAGTFLAIFTPKEQMFLLGQALAAALDFTKEKSCRATIESVPTT